MEALETNLENLKTYFDRQLKNEFIKYTQWGKSIRESIQNFTGLKAVVPTSNVVVQIANK